MALHLRTIFLTSDDARRTFTRPAQDGVNGGRPATYRVAQIMRYDDGSVWVWAEQMTKSGRPYKSGMGYTLGAIDNIAKFHGQDVADVVTEALAAADDAQPTSQVDGTVTMAHPIDESLIAEVADVSPSTATAMRDRLEADNDREDDE